jgi:nucleotide-binding universal stress UspA family protein
MIRSALSEFCRESGIGNDHCGVIQNEIVIKEGDVVEEILSGAAEHSCDFIIMGTGKGLLTGSSVGHHIRSVLKKSSISTLVVPVKQE